MIILKTHDAPMLRANAASGGPEMEMSCPPGFSTRRDFSSVTMQDNVVVTEDVCEVFLLVIDHDVGPEASDQIDVGRARRRRHRRADVLRQLNGKCAHTT